MHTSSQCFFKWLAAVATSTLLACAPLRQNIPPGVVPAGEPWSPEKQLIGRQAVLETLKAHPMTYEARYVLRAQSVLDRIFSAINSTEQWHVFVVENSEWNAFCAPGNNMVIYTGLLNSMSDNDELAAVLGHELSHDLARHGDDESLNLLTALTAELAKSAAERTYQKTGDKDRAMNEAMGITLIGNGLFIAPYSQSQELEADRIGLFLMADAGFNPEKAPNVWMRKARKNSSSALDSLLGTHPPSAERAAALLQLLPLAKPRFLNYSKKGKTITLTAHSREIARDNRALDLTRASDLLVTQGIQYFEAAQYDSARQLYERALQADPHNAYALNGLGTVAMASGNPSRSQQYFERMLKLAPYSAAAHYNLACTHSVLGQNTQALKEIQQAIAINPQLKSKALDDGDLVGIRMDPRFDQALAKQRGGATFVINSLE